ncbi:MAG: M48 family metallopeptidase [Candidatus Thiodiazotropha lotti]|nr:M48 family metallopeptidase [Candidatus Thiodiazotropha lotti]MCG8001896.1 M48 family metallopeptidase [Candidatus Thiodiazotropha lotti]MCG8009668.1 M48 family metallopeptidase [Candidatus Thiodiazotropha lotti]MCW4185514.1 M48 family metallopeptidase [Candidatus Thiodiazotropha lotti]MCW4197261.1 M48 family metallopeptidase [Candidatus Thiodiazotropha lotti]
MVEQCLQYGDLNIPYQVFFVPGREGKIAIHVHPDGSVQVDAPAQASLAEIKQAVGKRSRWLSTHLDRIKAQKYHVLPREYVSGESHFYLGRRYLLKVRVDELDESSVKLRCGQLQVTANKHDRELVKSLLWQWYRAHARTQFDRRLGLLWQNLSWVKTKPTWKLLTMKKQWGSCSPNGVLSLNPHLVKAPSECIDYVLLHELCHLKSHNHSPAFYRQLRQAMPTWESVKARLDGMAELLLNE